MRNFLISSIVNLVLILVSYFLFRSIISGPTRHKIYEKIFSSFAKFIIYTFIFTIVITGVTALIVYRTRFVIYLNIIAPALVSILIGFLISTVPTKGIEESSY
ncbi:hypothetical protein VT91_28760 [Clostridium sporogenes]|uniref:hypothetical protein n=1 Tax=Clostridium botulinum TaxID=1491 RepID=UPI0007175ED9|nr:hypothetical protein [Clostridium botulinum]KRU26268.1 hypothetical protein VT91_28760 [Clostridium sporogenes]KRU26925.1 hypothetical protein WG71_23410 [Clostridium sporogenes]KRU29892.1 hypothetical protein VT28_16710 [Clostridium sporogenes]KRU44382.1 hypothetical protein VT95_13410 [Clostridium sporogenes]MBZ1329086.1 hypothetical protein [Clostridium botulinum]